MDQKGHIIDQKGLKMYEKAKKMAFLDLKYLTFFFFLSIFHSLFTISYYLFLITYYFFPFSYFFSCTSMPSALSLHSQLNKWIILSERFPSFLRTSQNLLIYYIPLYGNMYLIATAFIISYFSQRQFHYRQILS